jgi:ketosteroid isomerase-like protein
MTQNSNETQIRALVEKWASAVRAKDIDGVPVNHTDDIVMFDVPPAATSGRDVDLNKANHDTSSFEPKPRR